MGSRPTSSVQMTPRAALSSPGIRAPLTVDESDFEYSASSKSRRNSTASTYYSGSELEYEDFSSDEYELQNVTTNPYFTGQVDDNVEYAFSGPFVKNPVAEGVKERCRSYDDGLFRASVKKPLGDNVEVSSSSNGGAFFRPFVRNSMGITFKGFRKANESDDSTTFSSDSDEDSHHLRNDYFRPSAPVADEEVSDKESFSDGDLEISLILKSYMPVAQISRDTDDDSQGSEDLEENDGISGMAMVPRTQLLQRLSSASKVNILEVEKKEDFESEFENTVVTKCVLDVEVSNDGLSSECEEHARDLDTNVSEVSLGIIEAKDLDATCEVRTNSFTNVSGVSVGIIEAKDLDVTCEGRTNSMADDENHSSLSGSDGKEDLMHIEKDMQEIYGIEDETKYVDLVSQLAEETMLLGHVSGDLTNAEPSLHCGPINLEELEILESNDQSCMIAVPMVDYLVFDQGIQNDEFEEKREQKVSPAMETMSSKTLNQVVEIEERPNEGCPQFSELSDALVYSKSVSQEITFKAEHSEELRSEVENPTCLVDVMELVVEMEEHASTQTCLVDVMESIVEMEEHASTQTCLVDVMKSIVEMEEHASTQTCLVDVMESIVEMEEHASNSLSGGEILQNHVPDSNGQIVLDSDKEVDITRNLDQPSFPKADYALEEALSEGEKELEKIQQIRVKYLQLLHGLGVSPGDAIATKVLYQLEIAEVNSFSKEFLFASNKKTAMDLEVYDKNDLNFSLSILVIGKTGVGKSATINSIFGERKTVIDAFEPATTNVKEIIGMIDGVKVKVFDSPGLRTSLMDQSHNRKVLSSIKKLVQKSPPDIVLYVDRLDMHMQNFDDLSLLKSVSTYVGSSIWSKSVVAFTHATSAPPDGPDGHPLSYEAFVSQRSNAVRQMISFSVEVLLAMNLGLTIPVALVENHPSAEKNERGESLLHDGESWRSQLLLLCYSMKILSELNSVVKTQNPLDPGKLFGFKIPSLSLPCFLSSSLQSTAPSKLSDNQSGKNVDSAVVEWGFPLECDREDADYHNLSPFKPLMKSQMDISNEPKKQHREVNGASNGMFADKETRILETAVVPLSDMDANYPSSRYHFYEPSYSKHIYVLKGEPEIRRFKMNRNAPGASINFLGDDVIYGIKVEDEIRAGKCVTLIGNAGAILTQSDAAYKAGLEVQQEDIGSLCLCVMKWKGDLTWGCNLFATMGKNSKLQIQAGLNKKLQGQVSVRTRSWDSSQIYLLFFLVTAKAIFRNFFPGAIGPVS